MKILTDLQNIVSAVSTIIVSTTKKSNLIIDNVMDVGVITTGEWKSDAVYDAKEAQLIRQDKLDAYDIKKAAKAAKRAKAAETKETSTK